MSATTKISLKRASLPVIKRASSEELGEDKPFVKNNKSGRPARKGAGKRSLPANFVVTDQVVEKEDEDDSGAESLEDEGEIIKVRPKRQRRHLSPPARELSPPVPVDVEDEQVTMIPLHRADQPTTPAELTLTFNVPSEHVGPFVVKLDLSSLPGVSPSTIVRPGSQTYPIPHAISSPAEIADETIRPTRGSIRRGKRGNVGFIDFPAELRNIIYRHVLVSEEAIDFRSHKGFSRGGGLLSTCRQVYEESRHILYGENEFKLFRDSRPRGQYWIPSWQDIGYKDVRRFLQDIGPVNISHLRKVAITFEDPASRDETNPPFVNDDHLIECLKMLAQHGAIKELKLAIHGRAMVRKVDTRFVCNLRAVQADDVQLVGDVSGLQHRFHGGTSYYNRHQRRVANLEHGMESSLVSKMQRQTKLYPVN